MFLRYLSFPVPLLLVGGGMGFLDRAGKLNLISLEWVGSRDLMGQIPVLPLSKGELEGVVRQLGYSRFDRSFLLTQLIRVKEPELENEQRFRSFSSRKTIVSLLFLFSFMFELTD